MDEKKAWVVWPEYFDAALTRAQGRKVKKALSIASPTLEMLEKAVQRLGLEYKVESDKAYPGDWYEKRGRVLVDKKISKGELLAKMGDILVKAQRS